MAAIGGMRADSGADIGLRQSKYIDNLVEQDHRAIKRIVRPMLGFKSFHCARAILAGIETMHMNKKGQLDRCEACAQQPSQLDDGDGSAALHRWTSQEPATTLSSP